MDKWLIVCFLTSLFACGGSDNTSQEPSETSGTNPDLSGLEAFSENSPYANVIPLCVDISDTRQSCAISILPPIGTDNPTPEVNDIMQRVVVSHDWMGTRFENLLQAMPDDILLMFRATTAVVIHANIRPSHFRSDTGAIYLNPSYLWLTNDEKATISQHPDFRSNFGDELSFKHLWRYVINNEYAWQSFSLTGSEERQLNDTLINTSWLLFHELAHANDCLPPAELNNLFTEQSFFDNFDLIRRGQRCVQQQLTGQAPLTSDIWQGLAQVLYQGETASNQQKDLSPLDVGDEFATDHAMDSYSYSSVWEDTAMAFEAILMKKNFDADRDLVFVPFYEEFDCNQALVKWGQRGRMSDPSVLSRAQTVVSLILPELELTEFYQQLSPPTQIAFDTSYCATDLNASSKTFSKLTQDQAARQVKEIETNIHR